MKTLAEQIRELMEKAAANTLKMENILTKAESEDRGLSEDEQAKYDVYTEKANELDGRITNLEKAEKRQIKSPAVITDMHEFGQGGKREKGVFFARMAHALYVNDGDRKAAADYVRKEFDDRELESVLKISPRHFEKTSTPGAMTSVPEYAGALTYVRHAAEEFIDMLRPLSIMARIGARRMAFDGANQIKIPRNSGGVPAGQGPGQPTGGVYIGESKAIPVKAAQFDQLVLTPKKIAVITASSTENLERSSPSLEMILRDDMLANTAAVVDVKFCSTDAPTTVAPGGIFEGVTSITPSADADPIVNMMADLQNLFGALIAANCASTGLTLIMDPNNYNALMFAQIDGVYLFRDELSGGTLFGANVLYSNTVPQNFCGLVDPMQIIIAEDQAPTLDISETAAVHMDDTPSDDLSAVEANPPAVGIVRSLWQSDMAAIRLRWRHDWNRRLDQCSAFVTPTAWVTLPAALAKAKANAKK